MRSILFVNYFNLFEVKTIKRYLIATIIVFNGAVGLNLKIRFLSLDHSEFLKDKSNK